VEKFIMADCFLFLLDQEVKRHLLQSVFLCDDSRYVRDVSLQLFELPS